jgi:hypothetical protein
MDAELLVAGEKAMVKGEGRDTMAVIGLLVVIIGFAVLLNFL